MAERDPVSLDDTFKRPIGVTISDEELADFVIRRKEEARVSRQTAEVKWLISSTVLDGFHNFFPDWYNRRVFVNPVDPKGSVRVRIPELLTRYRREKGRLLSFIRPPITRPRASGDPAIWRSNRFGSGAASYIYHNSRFAHVADTWLSELLIQGTAGLLPFWDESKVIETPQGISYGEITFRSIPGWQLYPFPADAIDDDGLSGLIWSRPVSMEWIKQNIPEAEGEKTIRITSPLSGSETTHVGSAQYEGFDVSYIFFKPSRRFPKGEMAIVVGRKVYRRVGALNFFIGNKRVIPISVARYTKKPTSWWGESFAYPIARLNSEINKLMSLLMRRAVLRAHPGYLMVPSGSVTMEDFKKQHGGVVQYRGGLVTPENKPYWLTYPSGPPDSDVILNRMMSFSADASSQHGATMGDSVGRIDSNSAIQSLIRQDVVPLEGAIKQMDEAIKSTFSISLDIAQRRWDQARKATIVGPMGMSTTLSVAGNQIPNLEDIEVITGLDMPLDRAAQVQFLTNLAAPSNSGMPPMISQVEYRRGLMALGINLPGVSLIGPDEEQAWIENMTMFGDGSKPGRVEDPDPALENSQVHIDVHKQFAARPEVHAAEEAVRETIAEHIRKTGMNLQVSPVPPAFDADLQQDDAEELADEVELGMSSPMEEVFQKI